MLIKVLATFLSLLTLTPSHEPNMLTTLDQDTELLETYTSLTLENHDDTFIADEDIISLGSALKPICANLNPSLPLSQLALPELCHNPDKESINPSTKDVVQLGTVGSVLLTGLTLLTLKMKKKLQKEYSKEVTHILRTLGGWHSTLITALLVSSMLQQPAVAIPDTWGRTIGGSNNDFGESIIETSDGDFVVAGSTEGYGVQNADLWLLKFNSSGGLLWSQTVGGSDWDRGYSVTETINGSIIVTGTTYSYGAGATDMWLLKFSGNGTLLWAQAVGGSGYEYGLSVIETSDTSLVVTGRISSYAFGWYDLWLLKFTSAGSLVWSCLVGGSDWEYGYSVIETSDGSLVVTGHTESYGAGLFDLWLLKFTSSGTLLWTKTVGGSSSDYGYSVIETRDGNLVVTGSTDNYGDDGIDLWLLKFSRNGTLLWAQTVGGSDTYHGYSVIETRNGSLVVTGSTQSYGAGDYRLWLLKFSSNGTLLWAKVVEGSYSLYYKSYSIIETSNGNLVVTGVTDTYGAGAADIWLLKFTSDGIGCGVFIKPNVTNISDMVSDSTIHPQIRYPNPIIGTITPDTNYIIPDTNIVCEVTNTPTSFSSKIPSSAPSDIPTMAPIPPTTSPSISSSDVAIDNKNRKSEKIAAIVVFSIGSVISCLYGSFWLIKKRKSKKNASKLSSVSSAQDFERKITEGDIALPKGTSGQGDLSLEELSTQNSIVLPQVKTNAVPTQEFQEKEGEGEGQIIEPLPKDLGITNKLSTWLETLGLDSYYEKIERVGGFENNLNLFLASSLLEIDDLCKQVSMKLGEKNKLKIAFKEAKDVL